MNPQLLVDAAEVERLAPALVNRPTFRELRDIQPGAVVKINAGQKDFWAKVVEVNGEIITGVVPVQIKFNRDNIFTIFKGEGGQ